MVKAPATAIEMSVVGYSESELQVSSLLLAVGGAGDPRGRKVGEGSLCAFSG